MRHILVFCTLILLLGGCYTKQVRHLASDASLIKPGVSTKKEVLQYLGEPDGQRSIASGQQELVYFENKRMALKSLPLISSWTKADGYEMLVIILDGERVASSEFRTFRNSDRDWAEDFTWDTIE